MARGHGRVRSVTRRRRPTDRQCRRGRGRAQPIVRPRLAGPQKVRGGCSGARARLLLRAEHLHVPPPHRLPVSFQGEIALRGRGAAANVVLTARRRFLAARRGCAGGRPRDGKLTAARDPGECSPASRCRTARTPRPCFARPAVPGARRPDPAPAAERRVFGAAPSAGGRGVARRRLACARCRSHVLCASGSANRIAVPSAHAPERTRTRRARWR